MVNELKICRVANKFPNWLYLFSFSSLIKNIFFPNIPKIKEINKEILSCFLVFRWFLVFILFSSLQFSNRSSWFLFPILILIIFLCLSFNSSLVFLSDQSYIRF
ncbi:unnamed protein product [Meloidogyne enterolobii]|uniref:Uncharacterized protein n=1 Tax=Meloidogyne enterolobii TaxID=390850 RepID=A0ACB0Y5X4_MELEN